MSICECGSGLIGDRMTEEYLWVHSVCGKTEIVVNKMDGNGLLSEMDGNVFINQTDRTVNGPRCVLEAALLVRDVACVT